MTDEERKAWEELLHGIKYGCEEIITPYQNAILAADAELTRLRKENEGLQVSIGKEHTDNEHLRAALSRAEKAEAALCRAFRGLQAVAALIDNSRGVDGLHLNGDVAPWEELRTEGRFEEWLLDYDSALEGTSPCPHEASAKLFKERYELEQIRYEGISSANEELRGEAKRMREALDISPDEVGRIMHESWTRTKRAQGYHGPGEYCNTSIELDRGQYSKYTTCKVVGDVCPKYHKDLIPWEQLPEGQKDINRHAFDDVLAELRRRASGG